MKNDDVIRISIGRFDSEKTDAVRAALQRSRDALAHGVTSMKGNRGYFAGIDVENRAIVNVSRWESVESAKQMATFRPMLDLAEHFARLGVRFDRPILNFTPVWTIEWADQ